MMRVCLQCLLLVAMLVGLSGCGTTPTEPVPTEAPSPRPPTPTAVPTERPSPTPTVAAVEAEGGQLPPPAELPGETWTRPADGMVMVYVPGGEFEMGSDNPFYNNEGPVHTVAVDGFWLDRTEVTNAQYRACVEADACKPPALELSATRSSYYDDPAYDEYPVIFVSWYRALAYCSWVGGRLPGEAEWEYAARGPQSRWYPWGDLPDLTRLNYCDRSCPLDHADPASSDGHSDTAPVGSYPAGASWVDALDLLGNVWEWVYDWYAYYPAPDRPGWLAPEFQDRVIRGGGWDTVADHVRNTFRNWHDPAEFFDSIGFRCAVDPAQPAAAQPPSDAALGDTWLRPADDMTVVYVPDGTFEMGAETESNDDNEAPIHTVTLDDFWLDRTEVTNAQFRRCVEAGACRPPMERGSISRETYYGDPAYDD